MEKATAIKREIAEAIYNAVFFEGTAPTGEIHEQTMYLQTRKDGGITIVLDHARFNIYAFNIKPVPIETEENKEGFGYEIEYDAVDPIPDTRVPGGVVISFIEAYGERIIRWKDIDDDGIRLKKDYGFVKTLMV